MTAHPTAKNYRVLCLSEAVAPITHMSRTEGNEAIVAREPVASTRGLSWIPCLSGNAIRHRLIREPGMRWLVGEYDLAGKLSLPQLNFLFHGGALTEGGGREDTRRIADWQRLWPLGRLLGGSLPDQILAGSLIAGRGALVCEENRTVLTYLCGASAGLDIPSALRPAEAFVSGYQYTRGDSRKSGMAAPTEGEEGNDGPSSSLMIFAGQAITRGAMFLHDFTLKHASIEELGALLWSIELWKTEGGTIGGQSARGHGRLDLAIVAGDFEAGAAIEAYLAHARASRAEAVAWLTAAFQSRCARDAGRGKGQGKGKTPDVSPDQDHGTAGLAPGRGRAGARRPS